MLYEGACTTTASLTYMGGKIYGSGQNTYMCNIVCSLEAFKSPLSSHCVSYVSQIRVQKQGPQVSSSAGRDE